MRCWLKCAADTRSSSGKDLANLSGQDGVAWGEGGVGPAESLNRSGPILVNSDGTRSSDPKPR